MKPMPKAREATMTTTESMSTLQPTINVSARPMTGEEYIESLRDGREIWLYGERVKDVTTHPAFRNTARMIARLYDALHDPAQKDVLTTATDTGGGGYTHRFFRAPHSAEDLVADRDAIAAWARLTYGWMGRSPDYKAAFLGTLGANADFYAPYQDNATRWYKRGAGAGAVREPRHHPPAGRPRPRRSTRSRDVYVHVERGDRRRPDRQRRQGRRHRLGADALQLHRPLRRCPVKTSEFACIFMVPMNAPGREADLPRRRTS